MNYEMPEVEKIEFMSKKDIARRLWGWKYKSDK